jgi:hypothetical protein
MRGYGSRTKKVHMRFDAFKAACGLKLTKRRKAVDFVEPEDKSKVTCSRCLELRAIVQTITVEGPVHAGEGADHEHEND